jgi:hypothetical protein
MNELLKWLEGKKTYLCAFGVAATFFAVSRGWIDGATKDALLSLFGFGTIAAFRAGMKKK